MNLKTRQQNIYNIIDAKIIQIIISFIYCFLFKIFI